MGIGILKRWGVSAFYVRRVLSGVVCLSCDDVELGRYNGKHKSRAAVRSFSVSMVERVDIACTKRIVGIFCRINRAIRARQQTKYNERMYERSGNRRGDCRGALDDAHVVRQRSIGLENQSTGIFH